jgi:uncharacterized damage-inducible protein DinB
MLRNKITTLFVLLICLCPAAKSFSQASIPADSIKSMLIKDWERAKAYTQDYLKTMPANKYSLKAQDSIRTFAQQMLHLAQANKFFLTIASGGKPSMAGRDLEKAASAQSADSVTYYVNDSYDVVINAIKGMSGASMMETATANFGQPFTFTKLAWLMKAFEHQTHHRGQTTVYIRIAGAHPPQERLF